MIYDNTTSGLPVKASLGIASYGATYIVDDYGSVKSYFNYLQYAIRSFAFGLFETAPPGIEILNAEFNSFKGILLNGVEEVKIKNNTFFVKSANNTTGEKDLHPYGIYLDACKTYRVEENIFNSDAYIFESEWSYGVVVNNHHGEVEEIYKNEFNDFAVALEAVGQNKNGSPQDKIGLQLLCNNFSNNKYDAFVSPDYDNPTLVVGISEEQGELSFDTKKLAGNLFGNSSSQLELNYLNKGEFFTYFHHKVFSEPRVKPSEYSTLAISLHEMNVDKTDASCPIKGDPDEPDSIIFLSTIIIESKSEITQINTQLNTLVDGGNTQQLESEVAMTTDIDAWINYQTLMQNAGYLSEDVLDEISKKETGFNQAMIRNVLVANPQAAKSTLVQENLDNRGDQLPEYMRDQINMGLTQISSKEYLELIKGTHRTRHDRAINQLIRLLNTDTVNDRSVDIVDALSNTGFLIFDYKLVSWYDTHGQTDLADALLTVINSYALSNNQQYFFDNYSDLRNLTRQWVESGIDMAELDSTQLLQIKDFAALNNTVAAKAIALQQVNGNYSYIEPVYYPETGDKSNSKVQRKSIVNNENKLVLFPNPAADYFTVDYQISDPFNKAVLVVFDIRGKLIMQQEVYYSIDQLIVPSQNWPSGQYTLSILADGKTIITQKMTINK